MANLKILGAKVRVGEGVLGTDSGEGVERQQLGHQINGLLGGQVGVFVGHEFRKMPLFEPRQLVSPP